MKQERLVVISGPLQGQELDIHGAINIGRSPENEIQVNDMQVSRKHAIIQQTPAGTIIRDLGSGNGTYIGSRRVLEYRLAKGDIIRVGPVEMRYEAEEGNGQQDEPKTTKVIERPVRYEQDEGSMLSASAAESVYQTFFQAPQQAASTDQLRTALTRLAAIYDANKIIASERDLRKLFARVLDQIFTLVPAHNGVIMLKEEKTGELVTECVKSGSPKGDVMISKTIVRRAFEARDAIITYNAADDSRFGAGASIIAQNIASAMCTPLLHQDETLGVIYLDTRGTTNAFSQGDLELLVAFAGPAAIAIKNAQYLAKLEQAYQDTLIVLANAIELRDHYTVGHTWRVTNFALEIARQLGWSDEQQKICQMGGVLHDVGKIAIDDAILRKPGKLTDEEYAKMKVHPERGARLMRDIEFLVPLIPYALYHHERYDGRGYPYGLKGEDIPLEGRLLAVADTFDAMTSNRPYRKGLDPEIAIAEVIKGKGTQFDPVCADAMVECYRSGRIKQILQDYFKDGVKSIACSFCSTYVVVPEKAEVGDIIECGVCHRRLQLRMQNEALYGELMSATETPLPKTTTPLPATPTPVPQTK
ncbi:MAG: HD domain-containing protein [Candidatus Hydrogenedentes bacterium]|nr:HD domain-containing protein [Candidatus Hydrogenedentota bacterium]